MTTMNASLKQYFRRRKNRRNRRNYIFSEVFFHKISWFLCCSDSMFLSESKWHIWDPIWRVVLASPCWSISAGRGSLKSCYGVKFCWMLAKNALVYVKGNMMAFFVISTFKVLSTFSLDLSKRERWMGWTKIFSKLYFS